MNGDLRAKIDELLVKYPLLCCTKIENGYQISGPFTLCHEYNNIYLYDEYELKLEVPNNFPKDIPFVWETSDNIPADFGHWYSDNNALCLGATCEIVDFVDQHPTLVDYVDELIASYFYSATYYKKYGMFPYGDRSHNVEGIMEAYQERYHASDKKALFELLKYVTGFCDYRGHIPCPCGSGKKFRNCHGKQILKDIQSDRHSLFVSDALYIINYLSQRGDNDGKTNTTKTDF